MSAKHLTAAQRAELLVREELDAVMRAAGFRRTRLVFRREHGECFHELRFDTHWYTSGGSKPPTGSLCGWVTVAPRLKSLRKKAGAVMSEELNQLVPKGIGAWPVPMTKGLKRKQVGAELQAAVRALLKTLEPVVDAAAMQRLANRVQLNWWKKQLAEITRELKLPAVRRDATQVQELTEARARCLEHLAEVKARLG